MTNCLGNSICYLWVRNTFLQGKITYRGEAQVVPWAANGGRLQVTTFGAGSHRHWSHWYWYYIVPPCIKIRNQKKIFLSIKGEQSINLTAFLRYIKRSLEQTNWKLPTSLQLRFRVRNATVNVTFDGTKLVARQTTLSIHLNNPREKKSQCIFILVRKTYVIWHRITLLAGRQHF